jgi:hypothetical protein
VPATVLLDTPISMASRTRTVDQAIDELCDAVAVATGQTLFVGSLVPAFVNATTSVDADAESARTVLARILDDVDAAYVWHVYSSPMTPDMHGLDFRLIQPGVAEEPAQTDIDAPTHPAPQSDATCGEQVYNVVSGFSGDGQRYDGTAPGP